ncbi:MAG TPA: tetratricopeptide repeat protein [Mucilaginibacter sp.]|nr:tetratricopeptide repeat protein [Mucilaginibacter sp.]
MQKFSPLNNKIAVLIICFFLLIPFTGICSLPDTSKINRLNRSASDKFASNPDSTLFYAQQSIELSRKSNYLPGLANGLLQAGKVHYFKGRSIEAIKDFDEAILIFKKLNDQDGLSACYIQYGRMYTLLAKYDRSLEYLNIALDINKKGKNERALADCYKNIGIVYFSKGQLSKSLDFYYNGLFIAVKNNYTILTAELYNNIGVVLQNMEVYPNALEYYKKSLKIFETTTNLHALGTLNENIGEVMIAQGDYEPAIVYLNKANSIAKKQNDKDGLSSVYTDLGLCFANKKQYAKAIKYLDTSLRIAIKYKIVYNEAYAMIGFATVYNMQKQYERAYPYAIKGQQLGLTLGNLSIRANAALQLNKTFAGLGKISDAYRSLNEYIDLKNGLKNNESIQKLTSYNYELSFSVKQRLAAQQQRERELIYQQNMRTTRLTNLVFVTIILAMIVIVGIYYFDRRKHRRINRLLKIKNTLVIDQKTNLDEQSHKLNDLNNLKDRLIAILAHDLRAPLSTLRGLFDLLQDDSISHEELLSMIPSVLKKLEYTSDFLDTLLFWINSQMENFDRGVKKFRVGELVEKETQNLVEQATAKGISLIVNIEDEITGCADPDSVRIVVRNLITNAIKFCVGNDIIEISAKRNNQDILIQVKDTGIGMTPEQSRKIFRGKMESKVGTNNESGTGMGLLFCKDLIEKCNGTIWVNSEHGIGSEFSFTIPSSLSQ